MSGLKKLIRTTKSKVVRIGKNHYVQNWRSWIAASILILAVIFWILPVYFAKAPGQLGYGVKRFEESMAVAFAPTGGMRDALKLDFAQRRVNEAAYVAIHAHASKNGTVAAAPKIDIEPDDPKTSATINQLLSQFASTYQSHTANLASRIDQDKKSKPESAKELQKQAVQIYAALALLRVESPNAAQISVLSGIDTIQKNIATVHDALGIAPLSSSDVAQLTRLVSVGILSKTDLDKLLNVQMSNRQFHAKLVELVDTKKIPSDFMYALDEDLVKKIVPSEASAFEAANNFEQLQRISATIQAARPTKEQQQAIQDFLSKYHPGQIIPADELQPFVTPIVYGMALAGKLQTGLQSLTTVALNSDDQAMLDSWKGSLTANQQNLGQLYQQLMTEAASQPDLHARLLARVENEFVDAQKMGVDHLVLPPGWGEDQLAGLSRQVGIQAAANSFIASNPNTSQQLAELTRVQNQLQASLNGVDKTSGVNITELTNSVNNFTGTPEQVSQLKELLGTLTQGQTHTITELRSELASTVDLRVTLATAIDTLRREQLASLTELELQAASNAQDLTNAAKAELTTTLNQINQTSQNLISGLQNRVDNLDSTQADLQGQLNSDIQTIEDNYIELTAFVSAQLSAGQAATSQLQTSLASIQTALSQQASELSSFGTSTTALSQLINQVQTTSEATATNLQDQIDALKIDQQTIKDSINTLRDTQAAELQDLRDELASLSVLQAETNAAILAVNQQQAQIQTSVTNLTNNFATLEIVLRTALNAQAGLESMVADQQSQLDSLETQTQSTISQLTAAQAQITGLTANVTNLSQTISEVQTISTNTQIQLTTLLANPPWSIIPEGTYATQADFNALETSLNAQFAAKAAALDNQFQTYQQQINAAIEQVNTSVTELSQTTTSQHSGQQQTINTLNAQVQALQSQVQALIAPPGGL